MEKSGKALLQKRSHKLPSRAIELLLELSARGAGNDEIIKAIRERFGIELHPNSISYHRRKRAPQLEAMIDDEIADAICTHEVARLVHRIGVLDALIKREMEKKDGGSSRIIVQAISLIGTEMYRAELRAIKAREDQIRDGANRDDVHERILQEIERRSHITPSGAFSA